MMIFVLLVGLVNPALKMLARAWALRTSELVVVYAMMIVASAIFTRACRTEWASPGVIGWCHC